MTRSASQPGEWKRYQASLIPEQSEREKLDAKAARPLQARKPQQPADFGLFDVPGRAQLDLVEYASERAREAVQDASQQGQEPDAE